jgi:hypothetical protein
MSGRSSVARSRTARRLALVLVLAAALAACGGGNAGPTQAGASTATDVPTSSPAAGTSESPAPPASAAVESVAPSGSTDRVDAIDACSLLTAAEVASALGVTADRVQPLPGGALVPGIRTCFYRPPGVSNGPQLNVAVLSSPDVSRPASPSSVPDLSDVSGTWWFEAITGDLKLEALGPSGVRLTFSYQDTSAGPPTEAALAFLDPLVRQALARLP